jgi:hypothetical protein
MTLHVFPVTDTRRRFVINSELRDIAERGLKSNQPLLDRGEAIEFTRITMLTPDVHVVDRTCLRQLSVFENAAALEANIDPHVTALWETLFAFLKSRRSLQQRGGQVRPPMDGSNVGWRAFSVAKSAVGNG